MPKEELKAYHKKNWKKEKQSPGTLKILHHHKHYHLQKK